MIKVVVSGAVGRMGKLLVRQIFERKGMELAGALEKEGHPLIDRDLGETTSSGKCGVMLQTDLKKVAGNWDVLVEFSVPSATLLHLPLVVEKGKGFIIGTTGFTGEEKKRIKEASFRIPILLSPNMSVGVNLLFRTAAEVARTLGTEYDVEIVETHHHLKKDAPSGTALRLAEAIAEARGQQDLNEVVVYGRHGVTGEREKGKIGIHAVRGGTVAGEHTIIFAGHSERVELTHRAEGRDIFVSGAMKAIDFITQASPGLYDMQDVI